MAKVTSKVFYHFHYFHQRFSCACALVWVCIVFASVTTFIRSLYLTFTLYCFLSATFVIHFSHPLCIHSIDAFNLFILYISIESAKYLRFRSKKMAKIQWFVGIECIHIVSLTFLVASIINGIWLYIRLRTKKIPPFEWFDQ